MPAIVLSGRDVLPAAQRTDIYLTALRIVLSLIYAVGLPLRPRRRIVGLGVASLAIVISTTCAWSDYSPSGTCVDPDVTSNLTGGVTRPYVDQTPGPSGPPCPNTLQTLACGYSACRSG